MHRAIRIYTFAVVTAIIVAITASSILHAQIAKNNNLTDSLYDVDGNRYAIQRMPDNQYWLTENLRTNIPGSYCYDNIKQNAERYGRLYTWKAATAACTSLGPGWTLPAREDWQHLTLLYGGNTNDTLNMRKAAYRAFMADGVAGFHAMLGGARNTDGSYARIEAHGFYWVSAEVDTNSAWFYNFARGQQALFEQDGTEKTRAFSVRCVKKNK